MKRGFLLLIAFAIVLLIVSCTKNNHTSEREGEIIFASNIQKIGPNTKVSDNNIWDAQDAIGVYMIESENLKIVDNSGNVEYVTILGGRSGDFIPKSQSIYFPDNGKEVRFIAYHPYSSKVANGVYKLNVSDQTNQSAIDVLYSFNPEAIFSVVNKGEGISLEFDHALTKVIINVKPGEGFIDSDLSNLAVSFIGLNREVEFNMWEERFQNYRNRGEIVANNRPTFKDGYTAGYEAILLPTLDVLDAYIVFDLKNGSVGTVGDVFRWKFDTTLTESAKYTYNVIIGRNGVDVDGTIIDWLSMEE